MPRADAVAEYLRDPVHGFIAVNETERRVIDTQAFQRLRRVRQLAFTNIVYHGAEHSRFGHALGVMHFAGQVFDSLRARVGTPPDGPLGDGPDGVERNRQLVRLGALLHDVGHPPFSHASEGFLHGGRSHEAQGTALIRHDELRHAIEGGPEARSLGIGADDVADVIEGTSPRPVVHEIVSGDLDVDRMDYLLRDSHYTGVAYGTYDHQRLIQTLTLGERADGAPVLAIEAGGVHAAEGMLLARYFMFVQVYFHRVKRAYDLHVKGFLEDWFGAADGPGPSYPADLDAYLEWDDHHVTAAMRAWRDRSADAAAVTQRKHQRRVWSTSSHASPAELARCDTVVAALRSELAGCAVTVDDSLLAPHRFDRKSILVYGRGGAPVPIEEASPVLASLKPVVQRRVYVPPPREPEARDVLARL
jgi:HD superfamily phosphohydrolase